MNYTFDRLWPVERQVSNPKTNLRGQWTCTFGTTTKIGRGSGLQGSVCDESRRNRYSAERRIWACKSRTLPSSQRGRTYCIYIYIYGSANRSAYGTVISRREGAESGERETTHTSSHGVEPPSCPLTPASRWAPQVHCPSFVRGAQGMDKTINMLYI